MCTRAEGADGVGECVTGPRCPGSAALLDRPDSDITERRRAAEALQTSLEEFRTLAEAMPQIVWITRADGGNVYFNQHWVDYTGLTLEESLATVGTSRSIRMTSNEPRHAWQHATATVGTYVA